MTTKLTSRNRTTQAIPKDRNAGGGGLIGSGAIISPTTSPSVVHTTTAAATSSIHDSNGGHHQYHHHDYHQRQKHSTTAKKVSQCYTAVRGLWYRHCRRRRAASSNKKRFQIATALFAFWLFQYLLLSTWDYCFYQTGGIVPRNNNNNADAVILAANQRQQTTEESLLFAVVINTYRRPERLRQAVRHYADTCGTKYNVGQVFVVWAEQNVTAPTPESFFWEHDDDNERQHSSLRMGQTGGNNKSTTRATAATATVEILQVAKDSLNSRFEPIPQLTTTAVFMVDDDIRVDCLSLQRGFEAWKDSPDSMVGYYPRWSSPPIGSNSNDNKKKGHPQLIYHAWPVVYWKQKMNFVLTKASFLHSKYLELYTNDDTFPKEVKDHVDRHMNCEDIAMSMLVANYTRYQSSLMQQHGDHRAAVPARPIYVEGKVSDLGLFGGISTGSGHMTTRSECLTELTAILTSKGWGAPPLEHDFDLQECSYLRHAPGFWWQSRPSNVFELSLIHI